MPTGKRASMREGPLAALFRKTTEDPATEQERQPKQTPEADRPAGVAARTADSRRRARTTCPSPQERLRHAFSTDIPESLLERPEPPARTRLEPDPFERPERVRRDVRAVRAGGRRRP